MTTLNQLAEWLGGRRLEGGQKPVMTSVVATATGASENGLVKVRIEGDVINVENRSGNQTGDNEIQIPTSAHVEEGDSVIITMFGGALSKPLFTQVQGGGDRTHEIAGEAQAAIEATNQHFWDDDNGIHVATSPGEPDVGPNLLANSIGIMLRDGTLIRTAQLPSGFAVYDGEGNSSDNIIALMGDTIVLGKTGEPQLVLDNDGFEALNENGSVFFHVGYSDEAYDARGQQVTAPFLLFGDDGQLASRRIGAYSVAMGVGSEAYGMFSYAFGSACESANVGSVSFGLTSKALGAGAFAVGLNCEARDAYSVAIGDSVIANGTAKFACGRYNEEDLANEKLFAVGDGGGPNNRKDAFFVKYGGELGTCNGRVYAVNKLFENTGGLFTGQIVLNDDITKYLYLEVFFYDSSGYKSSIRISGPGTGARFSCVTQRMYNTGGQLGLSIKCRNFEVTSSTTIDCVYDTSGLPNIWATGRLNITNAGFGFDAGDFIGVTKILGYR